MENQIPRKIRIDLSTPAETAIRNAMSEVENLDADERLTNAVSYLSKALDSVSEYIDEQMRNSKI